MWSVFVIYVLIGTKMTNGKMKKETEYNTESNAGYL